MSSAEMAAFAATRIVVRFMAVAGIIMFAMAYLPGAMRRLDGLVAAWPRAIAAMLAVAAVLSFVMAAVAPINHRPDLWRGPPDEHAHRGAALYYVDHWLPPRVGDPDT